MTITRHFVRVDGRFVHYRKAGSGPPLLMVHQSPRSSAEYIPLIERWSERFTCIAPDSPGFGQSDPLPGEPEIDHFADGLIRFMDAIGLRRTGAYGFHSGGIILVAALKRHPDRFSALAVGGYAVWTEAERAVFGTHYLPPFRPSAYGEHLTWLWNRILEQSWFFPWFDLRPETRLSVAHDDPQRVHAVVMDMLDAGDAYRAGYGAVLRASRDIPPAAAATPPVLITAYDGDPLQAHLERLGELPDRWEAYPVATPAEHQQVSLDFLSRHMAPHVQALESAADRGFAHVAKDSFDGLIHWRGSADEVAVPAAGRAASLLGGSAIDPPGHGLSDPWPDAPKAWESWAQVLEEASCGRLLRHEPILVGDAERLFPCLEPDRFGAHLTRAWGIVRAGHLFEPWYRADSEHARAFDSAMVEPERLRREHLALLQARAARSYLMARRQGES